MSKVQQLLTMDEIEAGNIEQMWLDAVASKLDLKGKPGSEVTQDRLQDTNVTTLWYKNQPVAVAVRQRNDWNWTALTMAEIEPIKGELYPNGPSSKRDETLPGPSHDMKDWIIATANDPSVLRAFDQALIARGSLVTRDQRAMIVFDLCRAIAARGIPSEPQSAARTELIQSEARQRCIAAGYSLDRLACEDRSFRHDDLRPWWQAKFVPAIEGEIEAVEKAGFTVAPVSAHSPAEKGEVSIKRMALSDGRMDYYVSIKVGDREVTPHMFREEYKAAYHVALYDWLLNGSGEEPDCVDFGPDDWPAQSGSPSEEISHGGRERCLQIQSAWTQDPTCEWPECGCHKPADTTSLDEGRTKPSGIMAAAERPCTPEVIAEWLAQQYPDNVSTNAFCAAIRSLGRHQEGCAKQEDVRECLIAADRAYGGNRMQLPFVNHLAATLLQKFRMRIQ